MTDMNRRKFLSAITVGITTGLAGCSDVSLPGQNETEGETNPPKITPPGNRTTPEPIERPEGGYVDNQTGEVYRDRIEKDAEYIFAAEECYLIALDLLEIAYAHVDTIFTEFSSEEPDWKRIEQVLIYAQNATDDSGMMHEKAVELLLENGNEQEALSSIENNREEVVVSLQTLLKEDLQSLITEWQNGNMGYVAEHDGEVKSRFETIRGNTTPWRAVETHINSEYYNPIEE